MRAASALTFLFLSLCSAEAAQSAEVPKPFPIAVDQPAIVGEPIWVKDTRPTRYPYLGGNCIRLELLYDGKSIAPRHLKPVLPGGIGTGSRSLVNELAAGCVRTALYYPSPGVRLPLHIWFDIEKPGRYTLRWTYVWSQMKDGKRETKQVSSEWTSFTVQALSPEDHERWLRRLLDHPAANETDLETNDIPALVAAAPDERALQAIVTRLYSLNSLDQVAPVAAEALAFFPEDHVRNAIYALIRRRGPTSFLAHLVSWNSFDLGADANQRAEMTRTCFGYLRSQDPAKVAAAIEMILFNVGGKNPTPTDPNLVAQANDEVLNAAADIAETGYADPQRELILYMRTIKSPEGRRRLISMARSAGAGADMANAALIYDHAPEANGPLLLEWWEHDESPHGVIAARSYGVTITNLTDKPVAIERLIAIERKTPKGWVQSTAIQAVANCRDKRYDSKSPVQLAPHSSLAIRSWNGFLCGGQCPEACQQNVRSKPGTFRFVVGLVSDGRKISSLPFALQEP